MRLGRVLRIGALLAALGAIAGALFLGGAFLYLKNEVPEIRSLADYQPPQVTRIYADDGELVGELFTEKRTVVPYSAIPKHVVYAFLAAEDAGFFEHDGLDYVGILRAAIKNLRPGAHLQGASTITQQTVKTLILGPERSYVRKMREAILSRELEQLLGKEDILYLYLNQIYFGSGAYGVEEAARLYFGKSVRELDLGEGALLASIPKNPARYTPKADPAAAKERQQYVLGQMLQHGWAGAADVQAMIARPVAPVPPRPKYLGAAPHYVEHVKRLLVDALGEARVAAGGLVVYTGMSAPAQAAAHDAVRAGLEDLGRTHGYAGAAMRVEVDRYERVIAALEGAYATELAERGGKGAWAWNLERLTPEALEEPEALARSVQLVSITDGARVTAIVERVDSAADLVWVDLGAEKGRIPFKSMSWARKFSPTSWSAPPKDPGEVLRKGDVITVQLGAIPVRLASDTSARTYELELVPTPKAQGALVAIDPQTRLVRALVGGYELERGNLIRAVQSKRQPGSSFKPVIYAAGLAAKVITPASSCADSPVVIHDEWTGKAWKPENYEDGRYDGNITYRTALMRSKNTCSVKLLERATPEKAIEMARALGIKSALPKNLTLALGTGDVTPLEMGNAYATIAAGGLFAEPIFIRKIVDGSGKVLVETRAELVESLAPSVAYVLTQMMRSVVEEGTATRALVLDRPLAGKTGTSNESRNVWFGGFSPELAAVVWVGFDDNQPLGKATGGSTALPVWIRFMGRALDGVPRRDFTPPPDVVFVRVDPDTGEPTDEIGNIEESFISGTEPSVATRTLPSIFEADDEEHRRR